MLKILMKNKIHTGPHSTQGQKDKLTQAEGEWGVWIKLSIGQIDQTEMRNPFGWRKVKGRSTKKLFYAR